MPFFGTVAERVFWKKSKALKHIQIFSMLRSVFFRKTRSVTVPRFGFFQDSRIKFNNFVMLLFRYKFCNDDTMDSLVRMFGDMSRNTKQIPINR